MVLIISISLKTAKNWVIKALKQSFKRECKYTCSEPEGVMIVPEYPEKGKSTQEVKSEYLKIKYNWRSGPFAPCPV